MELYKPIKLRGSWFFDSSKYGYDYDNVPYQEVLSDLKKILTILIESKMLLPKRIVGCDNDFVYNDVDELVDLIEQSGFLDNCYEFEIVGETIIYTELGEKVYTGIFSIDPFRNFQQCFALSTYSDIWLPMAFDEDSFSFVWNLESYKLNNNRLSLLLQKISDVLKWKNESSGIIEYRERGCLQVGYDLFLNEEVISREYGENPNQDFNLEEYLSKIKKAVSAIQKSGPSRPPSEL